MKPKRIVPFILLLGSLLGPFAFGASTTPLKTMTLHLNHDTYYVEVAETPAQQQRGLQDRESLLPHRGMIFPYQTPQTLSFWMKDCKIALDLLFFRKDRLVDYVDSAPPCPPEALQCPIYTSKSPADLVLELPAGTRKRQHYELGSHLAFEPKQSLDRSP